MHSEDDELVGDQTFSAFSEKNVRLGEKRNLDYFIFDQLYKE